MTIEQVNGKSSARHKDIDLVERLAQHDETALRSLIEDFGRHIYGKAFQVLAESRLAEEVTQDTLLLLWWHPERFDISKGGLRSFLMRVAHNKAVDAVRHEEVVRSKESLHALEEAFFESPAADRGVADGLAIRAAVSQLSLPGRQAIFLAYYKGLTYREVARLLELPEGTVKSRIRDALVKLRSFMADPRPT